MATSDGSANAPAGTPQIPTLLSSYGANRPSWAVAGVDYYVGCPQGLALKDPSTISMAGVTVNTTTHIVTVTGDNVTLNGYDFSGGGGWEVETKAANTTISNCNFVVGANNLSAILGDSTASNLTVVNCTIDGAGHDAGGSGGLFVNNGNGFTIEYSWLKNSGGDMIQQNTGGAGSTVTIEHNLIQNGGMSSGSHGDYLQLEGGPFTVAINYNTTTQNGGSTQGLMTQNVSQGEIGHNVMTGTVSYFTSVDLGSLTGTMTVDNNYFDKSKGYGFIYPNSGPNDSSARSVFINNVDMTNGSVLQDSNAPTTTTTTSSTPPAAPVISSWSPDTGVVGDGITDANHVTVTGAAAANSTVTVYDGTTALGTTTASSSGAWSYATSTLSDGAHSFTAKDTVSGVASSASAAVHVTVDTAAPASPAVTTDSVVNTNQVQVSGTAEANSTITVYDGTTAVGTGATNSSGNWTLTTSALSSGAHALTATATDAAGNVSAVSAPFDPVIATTVSSASTSSAVGDGSATAPAGTPQLPHLLDSYGANRPAWQVAGVDYYVGCPQGLALKDPSTISMAGVTVNTTTHTITVTGNNVTLDGYDFSLNGGWGVTIKSTNVTINDCNFAVGSNNNTPIYGTLSSGNVTVTNCTIDGGMNANVGSLMLMSGAGTVTVQHTWLKNAGCDMIDMNNDGPSNLIAEYNVFQNGGVSGAHGDFIQFLGNTSDPQSATILYNTTTQAYGLSSQGFMVEPDISPSHGLITGGEIGYNTMTGANNVFTGVTVADLTGTFTVHDNYFDPSQTSGGIAFGGVRGGPNDSSAYSVYAHNVNMTNGAVVQDANAPTVTTPNAPVISSWSPDTGATGDGITDANKLTVKGTAAANSTVTVYDGSTSLGTATANSSGAWTFTTSALSDAKHVLTAKATVSGATSAASSSVSVTVDTVAPAAPVETSSSVVNTNHVQIAGTAEANSTITIYDGTTVVGTGVTNSSGVWNVTTSALSTGSHVLKATATDVAGNVSAASAPLDPVIGTAPVAPAAPAVSSLTAASDSGVVGDHITNDATPTVAGTAVANSTVKVYDGSTLVGTATASASGAWSVTTSKLADGSHSLTATDTDASSGLTSTASSAFSLTIDTKAPSAPTEAAYSQAGAAVGASTSLTDLILKGTAEANSAIKVFDGSTLLGTVKADGSGAWSLDTGAINAGVHSFTATATDAAGNTSAASTAVGVTVAAPIQGNNGSGATTPTASSPIDVTCAYENWNHVTSIKGTADANSYVKIYDGTTQVGTAKADASGDWHFSTKPLSDTVHTLTAQEVNHSGASVGAASGAVIVGSSGSNVLTSTSGDDYFIGNGHPDTFVFAANFGHDVIKDFVGTGSGHDTIQFSSSEFANFASVLSHASQVGTDVVIAASGGDTLTLKHTSLSSLSSNDFHFA